MSAKISEEIKEIINSSDTIKIVSAVGKNGNPHTAVSSKLKVYSDTRLAHYELLESSQLQKNLVYSIWFDKEIKISLVTKDGRNFLVTGKPYKALMAGREFQEEYVKTQEELGQATDLSTVWIIDVLDISEETYEVAKAREEKEHPYLMHMDHIYKEA
jgi:hypothetical protein